MTPSETNPQHADAPDREDPEIRELVESNPGQGTYAEYLCLKERILERAPCKLLVFGVGRDSKMWLGANEKGLTIFLEYLPEWIEKTRELLPEAIVYQVSYDTKRSQWKRLLERRDLLFMEDLPNSILSADWDIIFVDSPKGHSRRRPGRMKSIYTASVLARRSTDVDVFVHDCDRPVESTYANRYLGPERVVKKVERLWRFHLRPSLNLQGARGPGTS